MNLRSTALLIALGLGALPPAAVAQEGSGVEAFRAADADGDRLVSLSEFQTARNERFTARDRNRDGFLSREDLGGLAGRGSARAEQRLAEIDLDEDGRVSRREFSNHGLLLFENADADNDGSVNRAEIAALSR